MLCSPKLGNLSAVRDLFFYDNVANGLFLCQYIHLSSLRVGQYANVCHSEKQYSTMSNWGCPTEVGSYSVGTEVSVSRLTYQDRHTPSSQMNYSRPALFCKVPRGPSQPTVPMPYFRHVFAHHPDTSNALVLQRSLPDFIDKQMTVLLNVLRARLRPSPRSQLIEVVHQPPNHLLIQLFSQYKIAPIFKIRLL